MKNNPYNEVKIERGKAMFKKLFKHEPKRSVKREINDLLKQMDEVRSKMLSDEAKTFLELEIDGVLDYMKSMHPDTDEYAACAENLEQLYKIKANDQTELDKYTELSQCLERLTKSKESTRKQFPWKEVVVGLLGVAQILIIIKNEETNVITSKALGFINKGRV